jgi:hypothetical protein
MIKMGCRCGGLDDMLGGVRVEDVPHECLAIGAYAPSFLHDQHSMYLSTPCHFSDSRIARDTRLTQHCRLRAKLTTVLSITLIQTSRVVFSNGRHNRPATVTPATACGYCTTPNELGLRSVLDV